jgi:octaprenyl-diphosphate synthase
MSSVQPPRPTGDGALGLPPALTPAPSSLKAITAPIDADLRAFRAVFRETMRSDVRLLDLVTRYVLRQKGKQIRPTLVLLAARLTGSDALRTGAPLPDTAYRAASLVELLHTATLVHDDVVDEAERRRGVFSINALWKNKVAVLLGDFLLSRGLLLALDHDEPELLHVVSDAVRRMAEGELLQLEKTRHLDLDEPTYFQIIGDKTGSLIAACLACGAVSVGADKEEVARVREIGEKLGLAFQIRDDLFDYGGDAEAVGKPLGLDLQDKKLTLPLIHALRTAPPGERKATLRRIKKRKKTRADGEAVAAFVRQYGGLDYARTRMEALVAAATLEIETFPPSEARDALVQLARYVVARRK